jgi:HlyD family secretion protein
MKNIFTKNALGNPLILASVGVVVVIAAGSAIYYVLATRTPASTLATASYGSIEEVVTGTGSVEPAQNPDLAFQSGGRVAAVNVSVGQNVSQGEVLASLDTASLSAALAQAQATVATQQANLAEMQAGAPQTDIDTKQTAVTAAQQTLDSLYSNVPATTQSAYQETYAGTSIDTDTLFSNPNSESPTLLFQTSDSQAAANAISARISLQSALAQWQTQVGNTSSSTPSDTELDAAINNSLTELSVAQAYDEYLLEALGSAIPSTNFPQAQVTVAQTEVGTLSSTVNGLILSLQQMQQQIAAAKIALQSANDSLNQTLAGSTPQDIDAQEATVAAAQAGVESAQAALADAIVTAPFSGTVSSVAVKTGQVVSPNTVAVSLTPEGALQVEVYVSEIGEAVLNTGQEAQVTLDAYGTGRIFPANVVSVDRSPSTSADGSESGYKATLQFTQNDPAVAVGMGANVTIIAAQKNNVVVIPLSAVIQNNNENFVLVPSTQGAVEQPVGLGVESTSTVEITSGLTAGSPYLVTAH